MTITCPECNTENTVHNNIDKLPKNIAILTIDTLNSRKPSE